MKIADKTTLRTAAIADLFFTIGPRPYKAAIKQAQASLMKSKAILELAQSTFDMAKNLLPTGAISKDGYDIKENAVLLAQTQVNSDYCSINSPIYGRAGERSVDIWNVVIGNDNGGAVSS